MEVFPFQCTVAAPSVCTKIGLQWENGINLKTVEEEANEQLQVQVEMDMDMDMDEGDEDENSERSRSRSLSIYTVATAASRIRTRLCPSTVLAAAAAVGGVQVGGGRLGLAFRSMTAKSRRLLRREYSNSHSHSNTHSYSYSSFSDDGGMNIIGDHVGRGGDNNFGFVEGEEEDDDDDSVQQQLQISSRKRKR